MSDLNDVTVSRIVGFYSANAESASFDDRLRKLTIMTGEMAHDMNNALQVVAGNLELISLDASVDAHAQDRVRKAGAGLDMCVRMTKGILAFCRDNMQELPVRGRFSADDYALLETMISDALGKGFDLSFEVDEMIWDIDADRTRMHSALLNLVINARDAMNAGGRLTFEARNVKALASVDDDRVVVSVSDQGAGIPLDYQERIFQPFFTTKASGTGLGLASVLHFATSSGADFRLVSTGAEGTVFALDFPRMAQVRS